MASHSLLYIQCSHQRAFNKLFFLWFSDEFGIIKLSSIKGKTIT